MLWREKELRLWVSTGELYKKYKLNCLVSSSKTVHHVSDLGCHLLDCCLVFSWAVIG